MQSEFNQEIAFQKYVNKVSWMKCKQMKVEKRWIHRFLGNRFQSVTSILFEIAASGQCHLESVGILFVSLHLHSEDWADQ